VFDDKEARLRVDPRRVGGIHSRAERAT